MRNLLVILLLLLPIKMQAQRDTLHVRPEALAGSLLFSGGALVSFYPRLHQYEIDFHDAMGLSEVRKQPFDDVLQFVPLSAPLVMSLVGLEWEHTTGQIALLSATACLIGQAMVESAKYFYHVERPDGQAFNSFPSGHTYIAFTGADILRREYGRRYPWLPYVGYGVAALVGAMRVYNSRHWPSDVLAGAGIAFLSVGFTYWLYGK